MDKKSNIQIFLKKNNKITYKKLFSIIDNEYIFLDLPYYTNIGDSLIWKGTEVFLKKIPYKCLYRSSIETYITPKISKNTIILLQGGGNFGDLWRRHNDFNLRVLYEFPKNKIIILPKTVFYKDKKIMLKDAELMSKHPNLIICARDENSYTLLKNYFYKNKIILAPDMAFFISQEYLNKYKKKEGNKKLFLKRNDKELCSFSYNHYLENDNKLEIHDWPTIEYNFLFIRLFSFLKKVQKKSNSLKYINYFTGKVVNLYATKVYMPKLIKIGVQFISNYNKIYTTRLHGAILGLLLEKPIVLFDNSYGKNEKFYGSVK